MQWVSYQVSHGCHRPHDEWNKWAIISAWIDHSFISQPCACDIWFLIQLDCFSFVQDACLRICLVRIAAWEVLLVCLSYWNFCLNPLVSSRSWHAFSWLAQSWESSAFIARPWGNPNPRGGHMCLFHDSSAPCSRFLYIARPLGDPNPRGGHGHVCLFHDSSAPCSRFL